MSSVNRFLPIELTSINAATFVIGAYKPINPLGFDEACKLVRIINRTKGTDIFISFDGTTDHDYLQYGQEMEINTIYYLGARSGIKRLTKVFVRAAWGIGSVYLIGYY